MKWWPNTNINEFAPFFPSFRMHGKCRKMGQHRKNILGFYISQFPDHIIAAYNMTYRHIDLQNSPYSQNQLDNIGFIPATSNAISKNAKPPTGTQSAVNKTADPDYESKICLEDGTQIVCHLPSQVDAKKQVAFADLQISRQRPLRSWKGSCRTAVK